jgi:hypothetical protein
LITATSLLSGGDLTVLFLLSLTTANPDKHPLMGISTRPGQKAIHHEKHWIARVSSPSVAVSRLNFKSCASANFATRPRHFFHTRKGRAAFGVFAASGSHEKPR